MITNKPNRQNVRKLGFGKGLYKPYGQQGGTGPGVGKITGSVDTDTVSDGTLYTLADSSAADPPAGTVKANAQATQAVSGVTTQNVTINVTLPNGTYYLHYVQETTGGFSNVITSPPFLSSSGNAVLMSVNTADVPPGSLVYGRPVAIGDELTWESATDRDGGGIGTAAVDSLGLPAINPNPSNDRLYGTFPLTFSFKSGPDEIYYVQHGDVAALEANFTIQPKDADGFSILAPNANARLIYVDATLGNDSTAGPAGNSTDHYTLATLPNTGDWEDPGAVNAYATIAATESQTRDGSGDWVLLKKGEEFTTPTTGDWRFKSGISMTEPSMLTAYGATGARPHINATGPWQISMLWDFDFMAMIGIQVYPTFRDPNSVDFAGFGNTSGPDGISINSAATMTGALVEDCHFKYCEDGILMPGNALGSDFTLRRNIIEYSYNEDAFVSGISGDKDICLIEENIMYHCGWLIQQITPAGSDASQGQGTIFNHSCYIRSMTDVIYRNNWSIDPSSIHLKITSDPADAGDEIANDNWDGLACYGNIGIYGELGWGGGGNTDFQVSTRFKDMRWYNNFCCYIGENHPTNRVVGFLGGMNDHNGGMYAGNMNVHNNDITVTNTRGLSLSGHLIDVVASRNVYFNCADAASGSSDGATNGLFMGTDEIQSGTVMDFTNVDVIGNYFQNHDVDGPVVSNWETALTANTTFEDNKYFTLKAAVGWVRLDGVQDTIANFIAETGETGATTTQVTFVDDARTPETYQTSIGETATVQALIDNLLLQKKGAWDHNYDADRYIAYMQLGYKE